MLLQLSIMFLRILEAVAFAVDDIGVIVGGDDQETTTTNLFTELIPDIGEEENATKVCYETIGCLSMGSPWISIKRPLPFPLDPQKISASVVLFTRGNSKGFNQSLNTDFNIEKSSFDPNRPKTVFIAHGFASSGKSDWLHEMKNAYLENVDANIFILDWEKGSSLLNYLQVASNTRIVGVQLARFVRHLIDKGQSTNKIHLIGHSLGSHIMSYCAKNISEISKIGRISALDPAQPAFEGMPRKVRLDPSDAENVDVLHTDAKPFIPFLGFGMLQPIGTVDFYLNGGSMQPGCLSLPTPNITDITDLLEYPVEVISKWVSCSHGRSYEVFTAALKLRNCSFWGRKMSRTENVLKIGTLGRISLADPIVNALVDCTPENCNSIGLKTFNLPARGLFAVSTNGEPPYCVTSADEQRHLKNLLTLGLYDQVHSVGKGLVTNVFQPIKARII